MTINHEITVKKTQYLSGRHFGIAGAGLVGCLAALHLARHGARVTLIEKRPDLRDADIPGGRSIAMSLSDRGWHALGTVGLDQAVRGGATPKTRRCVHLPDGSIQEQEYGRRGQALWTVNRKTLNCVLLDGVEQTGQVDILFKTTLESLDIDLGKLVVRDQRDDKVTELAFDHVLGADGMNSKVRAAMHASGCIDEAMTTLDYRYFELEIPPATNGEFALDKGGVHCWPRQEGLFVALPNLGGTFTGTFFFAKDENSVFHEGHSHEDRVRVFATAYAEVAGLAPEFDSMMKKNPPSDIKAVRCHPWHVNDKICLMGDACHAIVPFFAMGMNTGFEDCTVLDELIEEYTGDMKQVFAAFSSRRKPCTDAIGDLSLRNFTSIGRSADPDYDRRWRLERRLWELLPDEWTPLYPMIHFGRQPLNEVISVSSRQREVLDSLMREEEEQSSEDHDLVERVRELLFL